MKECAEIMLREAVRHLETGSSLEKIYFVLFDDEATEAFEGVFRRMQAPALASATSGN
jgi:O-acetyl-ADP-ribose deacetylase (regulator of RNase III)